MSQDVVLVVEDIIEAEKKLNADGQGTSIMEGGIFLAGGYVLYTSRRPYIGKLIPAIRAPQRLAISIITEYFDRLGIKYRLTDEYLSGMHKYTLYLKNGRVITDAEICFDTTHVWFEAPFGPTGDKEVIMFKDVRCMTLQPLASEPLTVDQLKHKKDRPVLVGVDGKFWWDIVKDVTYTDTFQNNDNYCYVKLAIYGNAHYKVFKFYEFEGGDIRG